MEYTDKEVVKDILENFKKITGHTIDEVAEIFDGDLVFDMKMVAETEPALSEYVQKEFGLDFGHEYELLDELDYQIMQSLIYNRLKKS